MTVLWRTQRYRGGRTGFEFNYLQTWNSSATTPPPPSGHGDEQMTLGAKESLAVTVNPTIGGRWGW